MEKYFYYKKFDMPITYMDILNAKEYTKEGELVCNHPLVEKGFCTGGLSLKNDGTMEMYTHLIMKDGSRKEFKGDYEYDQVNEFLSNLTEK